MRHYRVTHTTRYDYSGRVQDSVGQFHLIARELPWQSVHSAEVEVTPTPSDSSRDTDYFGNSSTYFHVTDDHTRLVIEATSDVSVEEPVYRSDALETPWELARPLVHPETPGAWLAAEFAMPSPRATHHDAVTAYAAESFTPGRPMSEAVTDLVARIHHDFDYDSTATTVTSTVEDAFTARAGVCQDFAHVALAGLRGLGIAARYVSGYLATRTTAGSERAVGADASHAWIAVWLPGSDQWLAVDPTNNQWAGDRYITIAWGRDYGDVSPVKGIIYTKAKKSSLRVAVDVAPLAEAPLSRASA